MRITGNSESITAWRKALTNGANLQTHKARNYQTEQAKYILTIKKD